MKLQNNSEASWSKRLLSVSLAFWFEPKRYEMLCKHKNGVEEGFQIGTKKVEN